MDRRLPRLLPAAEAGVTAESPHSAANFVKCDGRRPACHNCSSGKPNIKCNYALSETEEARALSRGTVLRELHELFDLLQRAPEAEAQELLGRIRVTQDPISVMRSVQGIHILNSDARAALRSGELDPRLQAINANALEHSLMKVRSRPWTVVADDGIVSEMITSFFMWDDSFFYPFIDREALLEDMHAGDPERANYCSPFLVNAIYATRCFTSRNAKAYSAILRKDIGDQFLMEAKRLLDLEGGRPSLPTVQGLALMFTLSAYRGTDRAGMMYRYAAYEMLKRLDLEKTFMQIWTDPSKNRQKQIIAKALWGIFCFESIVAFVYLQQSLVQAPQVARFFPVETMSPALVDCNLDLLGNAHTTSSRSPPFVSNILDFTCDLSVHLYDLMAWNAEAPGMIGTIEDLDQRLRLHQQLRQWRETLPCNLRHEVNFTPQTCFLSIYLNELFIAILRPLQPDIIFDGKSSVKDLCIQYAISDLANMKKYVNNFSLNAYSCMVCCGAYNGLLTLSSHLYDRKTHIPFTTACAIIRATARDFPMARFILQAIKALCWTLKMPILPAAMQYLENLGAGKESLRDVPLAFALPQADAVRELLSDDDSDGQQLCSEMGVLLSKWSSLSIE
ncbi:putative C6 transcription factor [Truncatella angustata]|uniref:C6 transcription factor n=1 Tax=Truncatella angustata TaxID=152316 RepID=A0A9P8RJE7_9PEZI|nr:putative C6 transcription factor [Truncatella angustata]KAH6647133.1 putative C6 transcription factor [Truncatella angustata]